MLLVPTYVAASQIHGVGVFAKERIQKGTLLWTFCDGIDQIISFYQYDRLPKVAQDFLYCYAFVSDQFKGGYVLSFDNTRYLNHSDNPNTDNTSEFTYAKYDIEKDEEMTCCYTEFSKFVKPFE